MVDDGVKLIMISYHEGDDILVIKAKGHATKVIGKCHHLAGHILTDSKWRFDKINYIPPAPTDLASDGTFEVIFRVYSRDYRPPSM